MTGETPRPITVIGQHGRPHRAGLHGEQAAELGDDVVKVLLRAEALPAPYSLAYTSDTTSTSLVSRVPDGSKRFVKSLAGILVISFRIKAGNHRGQNQLFLASILTLV